jgi:hypothetical protein
MSRKKVGLPNGFIRGTLAGYTRSLTNRKENPTYVNKIECYLYRTRFALENFNKSDCRQSRSVWRLCLHPAKRRYAESQPIPNTPAPMKE